METQVEQMKIEARRKLIEQVVDNNDDHHDHADDGDDDGRKLIEQVIGHGHYGRGDHEHCGDYKNNGDKEEDDDGGG